MEIPRSILSSQSKFVRTSQICFASPYLIHIIFSLNRLYVFIKIVKLCILFLGIVYNFITAPTFDLIESFSLKILFSPDLKN